MFKDHNAVTLVRLEPAAHRSRVKHSTTEPLRSLSFLGFREKIFEEGFTIYGGSATLVIGLEPFKQTFVPHPKEYPYCILVKLTFIFLIKICLNIYLLMAVQYEGEWWKGKISSLTLW